MEPVESVKLSVSKAAERLGISKSKAYQLIADGTLPAYRVGGRILVTVEDLARYLNGSKVGA